MSDKPREWRVVQPNELLPEVLEWNPGKFVEASAYDALKAENERLEKECAAQLKFMSETDTEMEMHSETNRQLVQAGVLLRADLDRALAMLEKMAGALVYELDAACEHRDTRPGNNREWCFTCSAWVYPSDRKARVESHEALEQYRREFGEKNG